MSETVIVYGTEWCPDTVRSRKLLEKLGIDYIWNDIDEDEEACDYVAKVNKEQLRVPTILFPDGSILVEPADVQLEKKCRGQSYTRKSIS